LTTKYEIGRLLRAGTGGFVVGCRVAQLNAPAFGALVRVPLSADDQVYGLIHDIHIDDDGVVRQLVTADGIEDAIIADNRINRTIPIEMSVLAVGYEQSGQVYHMLPPRPPLSLDLIYLCTHEEIRKFTSEGNYGYLRHILRLQDAPVGELLAAHLAETQAAHRAVGNDSWIEQATEELISLLHDDYATLMNVLATIGEVNVP
jgi:hypothetical protein